MMTDTHMPVRRVTIASATLTAVVGAALVVATAVAAFAESPVPRPNPMREAPDLPPPPPPTARVPTCPDHESLVERLRDQWGERRVAAGLQTDGRLLELYASRSGSWTAVVTSPGGTSCPVAVGEGWRAWPMARLGRDGA